MSYKYRVKAPNGKWSSWCNWDTTPLAQLIHDSVTPRSYSRVAKEIVRRPGIETYFPIRPPALEVKVEADE